MGAVVVVEGAPVVGGVADEDGALVGDAAGPATVPVAVGGVGELELPGGGAPWPGGGAAAGSALLPVTARAICGGRGWCLASMR